MAWQDIVITIVQILLAAALLPSVYKPDKPALASSVLSSSLLAVLAFTFATLSLWFAAFSTLLGCMIWIILGIQKYRINRAQRKKEEGDATGS
jgi:predicted membrane protein